MEKKRAAIEEKMKRRKSEHEKFVQMEKELQEKLYQLKGKEPLYQKMEQRYHSEVMLPSLEEKKNKLKHLREFHKKYDSDAIR
jgi:hypothetical protein